MNSYTKTSLGIVLAGLGGQLIVSANNHSIAAFGLAIGLIGIITIFVANNSKG